MKTILGEMTLADIAEWRRLFDRDMARWDAQAKFLAAVLPSVIIVKDEPGGESTS